MPNPSRVAVVYSVAHSRRVEVYAPDDDAHLAAYLAAVPRRWPACQALVISRGLYDLIGPDRALQNVLGRPPVSGRCALVDGFGVVRGLVVADPAHYRHPEYAVRHDPDGLAGPGRGYYHAAYVAPAGGG